MTRKRSKARKKAAAARKRWLWRCKVRQELLVKDGNTCKLCSSLLTLAKHKPNTISIDHKLPRSQGGSDHLSNLQLVCAVCNHKKGNTVSHE